MKTIIDHFEPLATPDRRLVPPDLADEARADWKVFHHELNTPTTLWAYRFDADAFAPFGDRPHAHVASTPVETLGPPVAVGDLVALHERHGIELRVLPELEPYFTQVRERGLEFSGIRMGNAGIGPEGPFPTRR